MMVPKSQGKDKKFVGIYIGVDQHKDVVSLAMQRKINGNGPSSVSEIIRDALDIYLENQEDQSFRIAD